MMIAQLRQLGSQQQAIRTLLALGDQFLVSGTRFASTWMLARYCGADQLGRYALGFSVFILIDLLHQAFVSAPFNVFSQGLSEQQLKQYTGSSIVLVLLISVFGAIAFIAIGVHSSITGDEVLARVMYVLAIFVIFSLMREYARRYCFAHQHYKSVLTIDGMCSVLQLGAMYELLERNLLDSVSAHVCVGFASGLVLLLWMPIISRKIGFDRMNLRHSFQQNWEFGRWVFVTQVSNQMSWNVMQWIIAIYLSKEATGLYAGYLSIVFLSNPFVLGVANMLYPMLSLNYHTHGSRAMERIALNATAIMTVVMLSFLLILIFAGQQICDFLYNDPAYVNAPLMLGFLGAGISCLAISMPFDSGMHARRQTNLSSLASGLGLLITVIFVFTFVSGGLVWAAGGLLLGCLAEALLRAYLFYRYRTVEPMDAIAPLALSPISNEID